MLTVACPSGVVFERWVTPEDAELDQMRDLQRAAGLKMTASEDTRLTGQTSV